MYNEFLLNNTISCSLFTLKRKVYTLAVRSSPLLRREEKSVPDGSCCSKRRSLADRGGRGCWGALGRPRGLGRALWKRAPAVDWDVLGPVPGSVILGKSLRSLSLSFPARNTGPSPARPGPPAGKGRAPVWRGGGGGRSPGAGTHLRRASGTGRGNATRCPGPRRTRCRRTRTAAAWPTAAAFSPWLPGSARGAAGARPPGAPYRPARPGDGPTPLPLARFLISNLINGAPVGGARLVNG